MISDFRSQIRLGWSQYHLAVAGGYEVIASSIYSFAPTRYREVLLTPSSTKH